MRKTLFAVLASAGLLAACGGGSTADPVPAVSTSTKVSLTGVAAKGLMAFADVNVYEAKDGVIGSTSLVSGVSTDKDGKYSLIFDGTQGLPYVIKVTAKAGTVHADEATGTSQALPVGFALRALLVPATSGAISTAVTVTPFSEMAAAAAASASGGVTAANATQAISTSSQLLGFDARLVEVKSTSASGSSQHEQTLAVMLTAVSQLAKTGAIGCATGSAGDKTQCVVQALGSASALNSYKLSSTAGVDVSAALSAAVSTVLTTPSLAGTVDSSALAVAVTNLGCTSNCVAAPAGTTPPVAASATAITAAKLLFTEIKSDWASMFSRGGAASVATGVANVEAFKFKTTMENVHAPVKTLLGDSGAVLMGLDLYNDYKAGRTTSVNRGRAPGEVSTDGSADFSNYSAVGCALYQDLNANAATSLLATSIANANSIGCSARYFLSYRTTNTGSVTTEWRHGFVITPNADGTFSYSTRARRSENTYVGSTNTSSRTANVALQQEAFTGTLTPTLSNGHITGFTMVGELPAGFVMGGNTLANFKHSVSLTGSKTIDAANSNTTSTTISGNIASIDSNGATLSTLTVNNGLLNTVPVSRDASGRQVSPTAPTAVSSAGGEISAVTLNLAFATPTAAFEGVLSFGDSIWDKSGTEFQPTKATFSGAARNTTVAGVTTEFLSGVFTANTTGYAGFDATKTRSASNSFGTSAQFVGKVSAPNRPVLEITFGGTHLSNSHDGVTQSASLQYRTLVNGVPRTVVNVTGSPNATGQIKNFSLTEASANLSLNWIDMATTIKLMSNTTLEIGSLNTATGLATFTDGSSASLDIGL